AAFVSVSSSLSVGIGSNCLKIFSGFGPSCPEYSLPSNSFSSSSIMAWWAISLVCPISIPAASLSVLQDQLGDPALCIGPQHFGHVRPILVPDGAVHGRAGRAGHGFQQMVWRPPDFAAGRVGRARLVRVALHHADVSTFELHEKAFAHLPVAAQVSHGA